MHPVEHSTSLSSGVFVRHISFSEFERSESLKKAPTPDTGHPPFYLSPVGDRTKAGLPLSFLARGGRTSYHKTPRNSCSFLTRERSL